MMRIRKDSGFSLLEIIIVLAIAGGVMVMYTHYARKKAENIAQQNVSDALAGEMKGVLEFIDDDNIALVGEKNEIDSPLYSDEKSEYDIYHTRITNEINTTDTGSEDSYYLWGDDNNKTKQQRYLFLSSNCKSSLKSEFAYEKEYLSCFMRNVATNSTAVIDRIGFYGGDKDSDRQFDINRIDTIVRFEKEEQNSDYYFADFAPHFAEAFSKAGFTVSHSMIVHRANSTSNWQLILDKKDKKTPIELSSMANNLDALDLYKKDEFGVRFTIETNDNSGNSSNAGGKLCWSRGDSGVKLCYDDKVGTGAHGEDTVLDLTMTDPANTSGNEMMGTLKANLVMENTGKRVYLFNRTSGNLVMDENDNPTPILYDDINQEKYPVEITMNDSTMDTRWEWAGDYPPETYDAYELVTPSVTSYSELPYEGVGTNIDHDVNGNPLPDDQVLPGYQKYSDYAGANGGDEDTPRMHEYEKNTGGYRFPVQDCPKIEQEIILRNAHGEPLLDEDGKPRKYKYMRQLYPRLIATLSSLAAYPSGTQGSLLKTLEEESGVDVPGDSDSLLRFWLQDHTRATLSDETPVGQFGGIAVQVEIAEQNMDPSKTFSKYTNSSGHFRHENSKYVWVISSTMGLYNAQTGEGMNVLNPEAVSYAFTTWCSTLPQQGTPADLINTQQYE
ncbi:type II secretion system protein [Enterobacter mori]|uniref:type II secretion system protein n=1 Tax=Enterobacter mori TaxID=539813 RepID=UPI003D6EAB04